MGSNAAGGTPPPPTAPTGGTGSSVDIGKTLSGGNAGLSSIVSMMEATDKALAGQIVDQIKSQMPAAMLSGKSVKDVVIEALAKDLGVNSSKATPAEISNRLQAEKNDPANKDKSEMQLTMESLGRGLGIQGLPPRTGKPSDSSTASTTSNDSASNNPQDGGGIFFMILMALFSMLSGKDFDFGSMFGGNKSAASDKKPETPAAAAPVAGTTEPSSTPTVGISTNASAFVGGESPKSAASAITPKGNLSGLPQDMVDRLATAGGKFGEAINVNSGFRSQAHQDELRFAPGKDPNRSSIAKNSFHTHKMAIDINTVGMNEGKKAKLVEALVESGFTGFGQYETHIHADTRAAVPGTFNAAKNFGGWTKMSPEVMAVLVDHGFAPGKSAKNIDRSDADSRTMIAATQTKNRPEDRHHHV